MLLPLYCRSGRSRPLPDRPFTPRSRPDLRARPVRRRRPCGGCAGSVTAETAVLLPVLLVVLAACIAVLACVAAQLRCVDAARAAARVAARGDAPDLVRSTGERLAPTGARITLTATDGTVEVLVSAQVRPFGQVLSRLPAVEVSGRAVASVEAAPP